MALHVRRPVHPRDIGTFNAGFGIAAKTHAVHRNIHDPHAHIKLGLEPIVTALDLDRGDVVTGAVKAVGHSIRVADTELALQRIFDAGTLAEGDHDGAGLVIAAVGVSAVLFKFADLNIRTTVVRGVSERRPMIDRWEITANGTRVRWDLRGNGGGVREAEKQRGDGECGSGLHDGVR